MEGEHWAVLGLNGSGKTSLLQMIAGYLWPSQGTISVLGNRYGAADLRVVRRRIGIVSSHLNEFIHQGESVFKVVLSGLFASFGLYEAWGKEEREAADRLLSSFHLGDLAEQPYASLSQGEKQKTLIARALMAKPKLLILDEPCNGLDIYSRENLLKDIHRLCMDKQGPQLLYVTHRIEEVMPSISHALVMKEGRILTSGQKETVLTSAILSQAFNLPIEVEWRHKRPWVHAGL
jgi:iron complex transport system ATP-binding protein